MSMTADLLHLADSQSAPTTLPVALGLLAAGAAGLLATVRLADRWLREDLVPGADVHRARGVLAQAECERARREIERGE